MIFSRLFRTHFVIAALSIFGCVLVGSWALSLVVRTMADREERLRAPRRAHPEFFANYIEKYGQGDAVEGVKRLLAIKGEHDPIQFLILNEQGAVLFPPGAKPPAITRLPVGRHEVETIAERPPPPQWPLDLFSWSSPPGRPAGEGPRPVTLMRLDFTPARYLAIRFPLTPPPGEAHPGAPHFFQISLFVMAVMVLLGIAVALFMIFRSLREHVQAADHVISELQKGNLKARFPIDRNDEIGKAKSRFNAMADEIERLVERVRTAESSRNQVLQELAHDLRTPVASLISIHESVFAAVDMEPEVAELAELARREVEYVGRLVEDLLLLAQLTEPNYKPKSAPVDFVALLEEEAEALRVRRGRELAVETHFGPGEALLGGDEHLLHRLVRNALDNAGSYAKTRVEVSAEVESGRLRVRVRDDGPGFDPESLAQFGERRGQRMIVKSQGGRLSLGMGSVIMRSVVGLHRGELRARNAPGGGALIEFWLPLRA